MNNYLQEHWLTSFPSPSPDGNTSPLTLAIVVDDQRPDYNPSKATLSLVPLVPYAKSTRGGISFFTEASLSIADFKDIIPLLIARALRDSKTVTHAGYIENESFKNQYEAVLELKMNDVHSEAGLIFYGLSAPGDLFWLLGAPAGMVGMTANIDWKLYVQSSEEVLSQGNYTFSDTGSLFGFYYNQNAITDIEKDFFSKLIEYFITEIRKPLKQKSKDHWASLVHQHAEWRIAREETLSPPSIGQEDRLAPKKGEKNKIVREQTISNQPKNKYLDKLIYEKYKTQDTINGYDEFLSKYPNNSFVQQVSERRDELIYLQYKKIDTMEAYSEFLSKYLQNKFCQQAQERRDWLQFETYKAKDYPEAYQTFLDLYPGNIYAQQAKDRLEEFHFQNVCKWDSVEKYEEFILKYPNGRLKKTAKEKMAEKLRSYFSLVNSNSSYDDNGVIISGRIKNDASKSFKLRVKIRFETQTVSKSWADYGNPFASDHFPGKLYSDDLIVDIAAKSTQSFSRYFNTRVHIRYVGVVWDIFNTAAKNTRRLDLKYSPDISLEVADYEDSMLASNISEAELYLKKAEDATYQEGIQNLGNWLGSQHSDFKINYKLKAQIDYAETAIRIAPKYAKSHLQLASYSLAYALKAIAPDTKAAYRKKTCKSFVSP